MYIYIVGVEHIHVLSNIVFIVDKSPNSLNIELSSLLHVH